MPDMTNISILLIEDDILWNVRIKKFLENLGCRKIHSCDSVEQASEFLQKQIPDLVISDIMLNNNTIFELLKDGIYNKVPFLFITNSTREDFYHLSEQLEASAYLVKPFHDISLEAAIKTLMRNYQRSLPAKPEGILIKGKHNEKLLLKYDNIIYIKALKNYCIFKTTIGQYVKKESLTKISNSIGSGFIRPSRSYFVNTNHIVRFNFKKLVIQTTAGDVPIGRHYRIEMEQYFNKLQNSDTINNQ